MSVQVTHSAVPMGAAVSRHFPLGLSAPIEGNPATRVNVAVFAPALEQVVVCFQAPGKAWQAVPLPEFTDGVHHGVVWDMPIGSRYVFRAGNGAVASAGNSAGFGAKAGATAADEVDPENEQLLLDPYGRYIDQQGTGLGALYTSVRMQSDFDWGDEVRPRIPWRNSVFYEAHVRGQTMLHPDIPQDIRGSYAGMAHPAMIAHLKSLGVTAVELLPIHFHIDEPHLIESGRTNYWGYNSLSYFAPQVGYASRAAREAGPQAVQDELKGMVKLLHKAGIEVILDVVYNHTAEGSADRPALSWRGLADQAYYRHNGEGYVDTTGCGNSLDFSEPAVIQMAMDSLCYWVEEFHIDGFRFDLAVTLSRNAANEFRPRHPFLIAAATDRVLSGTKLIAEPWDIGYGGWQTGRFPVGWADWNDHFRDNVRDIWLSDQAAQQAGRLGGSLASLGNALAGSAELFGGSGRSRMASVNLVTAHDGFTLADLSAYNTKHNEANGENNRDGHSHNRSWNHGVEGPTDDPDILAARARTSRNLMATLLLSIGVPMITAGDEMGRTQRGNNNAYCQDNRITWVDWTIDEPARQMLAATKRLLRIREDFLAKQPSSYPARGGQQYLLWYGADGEPMTPQGWTDPAQRVLAMRIGSPEGLVDGLVVFNTGVTDVKLTMPALVGDDGEPTQFRLRMTTASVPHETDPVPAGATTMIEANSIQIYRA